MANANSPYGFQFHHMNAAGSVVLERKKTLSNATISVGDPLVLTNGKLKLAGVTSVALFGVSLESVTAVAATQKSVLYIPAIKNYVWSAQCRSTLNVTAGYVGGKAILVGTTNGKVGIYPKAAGTSVLQIVGLKPGSAWGTYAELLFVIMRSAYEGQKTA